MIKPIIELSNSELFSPEYNDGLVYKVIDNGKTTDNLIVQAIAFRDHDMWYNYMSSREENYNAYALVVPMEMTFKPKA